MNKLLIFLLTLSSLIFSGCFSKTYLSEINTFDKQINSNTCDYSLIEKKLKGGDDIILWGIQGGLLARNCGDYQKSILWFDIAEQSYKEDVDLQNPVLTASYKTRSLIINNSANPYEGNIYEKIMVNVYKGLDFMAINDFANARVEFNRALERQIIAKEYFAKEIDSIDKKNSNNLYALQDEQARYNRASQASQLNFNNNLLTSLESKYTQNSKSLAYPEFVNPFATYMSALFFLLDGSYAKSVDLFKENLQMQPSNTQIQKDFTLADNLASYPGRNYKKYVWLIYENGQGAIKDEVRLDVPIFVVTNSFYYTGIALPKLVFRAPSYQLLNIKNNSGNVASTQVIADMDSIISAEFNERYTSIAIEAITSVALKTIIQKQLNDNSHAAGAIMAFFQALTTSADIRSWYGLPKYFEAASIPIEDGNITIYDENGMILFTETLQNNKNVIIYVKSSHKGQIIAHKIYF
ncbi:MAG: COG3014 family protein [Campylobacteraceae bacterium]